MTIVGLIIVYFVIGFIVIVSDVYRGIMDGEDFLLIDLWNCLFNIVVWPVVFVILISKCNGVVLIKGRKKDE